MYIISDSAYVCFYLDRQILKENVLMCWNYVQSGSLKTWWSLTWRRVSTAQKRWRNSPGTSTHLKKPAAFSSRYSIIILDLFWLCLLICLFVTAVLSISVLSVCRVDVAAVRPAYYKRHPVRCGVRQAHLWIHGPLPEWPDHPAQSRSVLSLSHTDSRLLIPDYTTDFSSASPYPFTAMMWHFWCGPKRPFNLIISFITITIVMITPLDHSRTLSVSWALSFILHLEYSEARYWHVIQVMPNAQ